MGKCSVCKEKIEYNRYVVIDGVVYCPNCIPKKANGSEDMTAPNEEVVKTVIEQEEAAIEKATTMEKKHEYPANIIEALEEDIKKEPKKKSKKKQRKPEVSGYYGSDEEE